MDSVKNSISVKKYIISFIATTVITLAIMGICAVIFSFFPPNEKLLEISGILWRCFSAFTAAFFSARITRRRGLFTGVISAVMYECMLIVPGMLFFGGFSFAGIALFLLLSVLCGGLGGVLGINLK